METMEVKPACLPDINDDAHSVESFPCSLFFFSTLNRPECWQFVDDHSLHIFPIMSFTGDLSAKRASRNFSAASAASAALRAPALLHTQEVQGRDRIKVIKTSLF